MKCFFFILTFLISSFSYAQNRTGGGPSIDEIEDSLIINQILNHFNSRISACGNKLTLVNKLQDIYLQYQVLQLTTSLMPPSIQDDLNCSQGVLERGELPELLQCHLKDIVVHNNIGQRDTVVNWQHEFFLHLKEDSYKNSHLLDFLLILVRDIKVEKSK